MPAFTWPLIWAAIFMSAPSFAGPAEKGCKPQSENQECV